MQRCRLYEGKVLALDVDQVDEPGGVQAVREVVRHVGSVAILAVHTDGRLILVRQYRYAAADSLWEIPAGRLNPAETPEQAAGRELEEEVGLRPGRVDSVVWFFSTPGFCDERVHLFRATELQHVPAHPDDDERIETTAVSLETAEEMIRSGQIHDAKTIVAILIERQKRQR